jgi:two-component system LytT family sensor kinase
LYNPNRGSEVLHNCMVFPANGKWLYLTCLLLVPIVLGAFFWYRERKLRKNMQEKIAEQRSRASLEFHALQSQMDPHFIFNSLNAIHSYILSASTEMASQYLTRFSRLMRATLENCNREWITLAEELENLELYLQLEQLRFDGQFEYVVNYMAPPHDRDVLVPPFIVQPYVQNAIWHRLLQKEPNGKGRISIDITRSAGAIHFRLEDNGVARQSAFHTIQQRTNATRVAAERLHWLNARYHTHATITSGHLFDQHHNRTGTYTLIHLPDVTTTSLPEEAEIFK